MENTEQGEVVGEAEATEIGGAQLGSPISNEAYNEIAALHAKLEGLEAYRKFAKDNEAELWRELTRSEIDGVTKLVDRLEELVGSGAFRLNPPGEIGH